MRTRIARRLPITLVLLGWFTAATVSAQTEPPSVGISFGPEQIWEPDQDALSALFNCQLQASSCVEPIMVQHGASPQAVAFYRLTGWFLADLQGDGPVKVGSISTPFRANENGQTALLGGVPAVVYTEEWGSLLAPQIEHSATFMAIKAARPRALFWAPGPRLESTSISPQGGPRFVFGYRVLDGCHACTVLGLMSVGFDFLPDGTFVYGEPLDP
jgi:hypothetical protein